MGAVAAAIPVPPLAVGLATFLARDLFDEEEKGSGVADALASVFGITDVVPHGGPIVGILGATNNLLLFLLCIAVGTVVAAALILFFRKKTHKVH